MDHESLRRFNEAVPLEGNCADQKEIDYYWDKVSTSRDPAARMKKIALVLLEKAYAG